MQLCGVDAFARRQVRGKFSESLAKLPFRPDRIAAPVVIERDREVNHRLEEQPARPALVGPDLFQDLVADKELAAVEEVDAVANARVHRPYGRMRLLPIVPRDTCDPMNRRDLIKTAGAGLTILRSGTLRGQNAPSNKLNVALIGVWGRGTAHYNWLKNENVVALCDVNRNRTKEALALFPAAKTYSDWRRLLDQKDVEAVVICTADHHHAFIANWALNRNMHVYCEKPLGITVEETRTVRANYLSKRAKLATQHGTQRHAYPNFERIRELVLDGAIGELKTVHAWDARQLPRPGYPKGEGMPPNFLDYEQWIGPSPYHPYSPQYFGGSAGMNCLFWNMYRDFGVGQMGDMGAHTMDLLWNVIDAGAPTAIDIDRDLSDKFNPDITPVKLKAIFDHSANSWRGPVQVVWYQGGLKPQNPRGYVDLSRVGNGAIFEGTKGSIFADFTTRIVLPNNDDGDFSYYKRRGKDELLPLIQGTGQVTQRAQRPQGQPRPQPPAQQPAGLPGGLRAMPNSTPAADGFPAIQMNDQGIPAALALPNPSLNASGNTAGDLFQLDWLDACKGKSNSVVHGTSSKTHCDFDYSGTMIEQMLLGLVAHQAGKRLEYDPKTGRVTNDSQANQWLKRTYRTGWTLNG
jgi:predicted dehydrogenase